jgi:hypothetical protein
MWANGPLISRSAVFYFPIAHSLECSFTSESLSFRSRGFIPGRGREVLPVARSDVVQHLGGDRERPSGRHAISAGPAKPREAAKYVDQISMRLAFSIESEGSEVTLPLGSMA